MVEELKLKVHLPAFCELIFSLPLLNRILPVYSFKIYGGVPRFFYTYTFTEGKTPKLEDLLEYLKTADVDFKIRDSNPKKVHKFISELVTELQGTMEYCGNDYEADHSKEMDITIMPEKVQQKGLYNIWIQDIKFQLTISNAAAISFYDDYTVNCLQVFLGQRNNFYVYHNYDGVIKHLIKKKLLQVFDDYLEKSHSPDEDEYHRHPLIQKVYRAKKMVLRGYTFEKPDEFRKLLTRVEEYLAIRPEKVFTSAQKPGDTIVMEVNSHNWREIMKPVYDVLN